MSTVPRTASAHPSTTQVAHSSAHRAGSHPVRPTSRQQRPGERRPSPVDPSPIMRAAQACPLPRVAPAPRHPRPDRRHWWRHIALASPYAVGAQPCHHQKPFCIGRDEGAGAAAPLPHTESATPDATHRGVPRSPGSSSMRRGERSEYVARIAGSGGADVGHCRMSVGGTTDDGGPSTPVRSPLRPHSSHSAQWAVAAPSAAPLPCAWPTGCGQHRPHVISLRLAACASPPLAPFAHQHGHADARPTCASTRERLHAPPPPRREHTVAADEAGAGGREEGWGAPCRVGPANKPPACSHPSKPSRGDPRLHSANPYAPYLNAAVRPATRGRRKEAGESSRAHAHTGGPQRAPPASGAGTDSRTYPHTRSRPPAQHAVEGTAAPPPHTLARPLHDTRGASRGDGEASPAPTPHLRRTTFRPRLRLRAHIQ